MSDPKKGTGKKPKGSGRRLYTDENPKDTVGIKFATPTDARFNCPSDLAQYDFLRLAAFDPGFTFPVTAVFNLEPGFNLL